MSVTITTPFANLSLTLSAPNLGDLGDAIDLTLGRSSGAVRAVQVAAETVGDLLDAVAVIARRMDDPDRIEAIRIDESACRAELDVAARPVDPRPLH
ncbi:hypothetical protein [Tabrizicola soli]|uniref:Uncharacterized protein n=1 Tax=Tabrizicola soli TaxID=2185115 RepID=A0ABV7DUJ7_9RHOB|nr:hypothetical protein [Tabrizicola soli]